MKWAGLHGHRLSLVHPCIHYRYPLILGRVNQWGVAGAYPSMHLLRGRNRPWTGRQSITGHTHTVYSAITHTLIHMGNL
uniref:Uncharacterized protein n=1 Tax=Anguilla anguilla TaxID=7936 RepID=A0A0E9X2E1_ANGAN